MSSLTLLLVLSSTLLVPLECFLVSTRVDLPVRSMSHRLRHRRDIKSTFQKRMVLWRTLNLLTDKYGPPLLPRLPHSNVAPREAAAFPEATEDANNNETTQREQQQQQSQGQPKRQRKTKRPRDHVPVTAEGVPSIGDRSDDEPVVVDGGWEGAGPWVGTGPAPTSPFGEPSYSERMQFNRIMDDVLSCEKEEELPSKLTQHVELLLSVDVTRLTNDLIRQEPTLNRVRVLHNAYDFIVTFLEGVVENTLEMQKENRSLLKEIIEAAKTGPEQFEVKMLKLQDQFSFQFVKYLNAEIERLEKGSKSPGAGGGREVLNVMKIVRVRVCAQVDLTFGEDVAALSRLLSYDDRYLMRAALRSVIGEKSEDQIEEFGKLVATTLKDVNKMQGADPLLRHKLKDMVDDVEILARDSRNSREEDATKNAQEKAK